MDQDFVGWSAWALWALMLGLLFIFVMGFVWPSSDYRARLRRGDSSGDSGGAWSGSGACGGGGGGD